MFQVLVTDQIDPAGINILSQIARVDIETSVPPDKLARIIPKYDALMLRSGTKVTREAIEAGSKLKIIGRAGVGVDNIDVQAATRKGIIVVNSPGGNTVAAAEHTLAMMLALSRQIPDANHSIKSGMWERKRFVGTEVYHKTLGVIGLGKIGAHVATVGKTMGMNLLAYDPFVSNDRAEQLNCRLVELDILFKEADYITLHVPKTSKTANLIDEIAIAKMKPTVRIINCSRGGIVDEMAICHALSKGKIAGAALDVFANEPLSDSPLTKFGSNLILTPHLGASTKEAQVSVAIDVAEQVRDVLIGLPARSAVNMPGIDPDVLEKHRPYLQLAEILGNITGQLTGDRIHLLGINLKGKLADNAFRPLVASALKGLLFQALQERINYVNANIEAKERGIRVIETKDDSVRDYSGSVCIEAKGYDDKHSITGTILGDKEIRIIALDEFPINVPPSEHMLIIFHQDMPGIVGKIGFLLGNYNINIASMQVGRKVIGGKAVMILSIDVPLPENNLGEITKIDGIHNAYTVNLAQQKHFSSVEAVTSTAAGKREIEKISPELTLDRLSSN